MLVPALHDCCGAQVVASSAAASRGCADLAGHFGHLLTCSPAAAVPEQAPPAAAPKLAAAAAMLQRLLGKRAATNAELAKVQTSSWQVRPIVLLTSVLGCSHATTIPNELIMTRCRHLLLLRRL